MIPKRDDLISRIMLDPQAVHNILKSAVNEALLKHKQAGNPVCELKDGKVVWIKPQDIMIRNQ